MNRLPAIMDRRSIRKFEDRSVEREKLEAVLRAAMQSPTETTSSAPMASSSRSMLSAAAGPMVTRMTLRPRASFSFSAASTAFLSSGFVMTGMEARFRVPSSFTATLPEVSGTCFRRRKSSTY